MIFSGGQLGISLAYSLVPLVIFRFLKNIEKPNIYNSIFLGLVLSLQLLFDPRIFLIAGLLIFAFLFTQNSNGLFKSVKYTIIIPLILVSLIHSFWILPLSTL
jgi:hypothetical protein